MPGQFIAATAEVPQGALKEFDYKGRPAILVNVRGEFKAYIDICLHRGGPCRWDGDVLRCQWHNATWDPATGQALSKPAPEGSSLIPIGITVENGKVYTLK
ncbi:MAG: Rieske (2Fe-2S) protein [Anaerolineae bacterium]